MLNCHQNGVIADVFDLDASTAQAEADKTDPVLKCYVRLIKCPSHYCHYIKIQGVLGQGTEGSAQLG
jgi:hypothetical protein